MPIVPDDSISFNGSTKVTYVNGQDLISQIGEDLTLPQYDFLTSLSDIGITWDIVDGVPVLTGNAKPEQIPETVLVPKPNVSNSQNGSNLVSILKESNLNSNSYMNQQNTILDNQNKLLEESNKINRQIADALANANAINASNSAVSTAALLQIAQHLNIQNIVQAGQVDATLESAYATHRIANSQIPTNQKIQESLDYQKDGEITASDGEKYSPREIEAKANAESHLGNKDVNEFDWDLHFASAIGDDVESDFGSFLLELLEDLKTTPFEVINSYDDGKALFKREVVNG